MRNSRQGEGAFPFSTAFRVKQKLGQYRGVQNQIEIWISIVIHKLCPKRGRFSSVEERWITCSNLRFAFRCRIRRKAIVAIGRWDTQFARDTGDPGEGYRGSILSIQPVHNIDPR